MRKDDEDIGNLGSIFKGLDKFINLVSDMVENEKNEVNIDGSFGDDNKDNRYVGKYGVNIHLGAKDLSSLDKINTLTNIGNKKEKKIPTSKLLEPPSTDIFEEENSVIIVMELPGVQIDNIEYELQDNIVTIRANVGPNKYYKNISLKFNPTKENITYKLNNSIYSMYIMKNSKNEVSHEK